MITSLEKKFTAWQSHYRIDGNSLGFYRILFCAWFAIFRPYSYSWIADVPQAFYNPPMLSFASLFDRFPSDYFFQFLDATISISLVLVAVGFLTRISTCTLLLAQVVGNNFQYSFGKIDHAVFVQCVLFVMLLVNWGQSLSIDQLLFKRRQQNTSSIWLLAVLLAFGFFSAGFGKALVWLDFDPETNGFLAWFYSSYYNMNKQALLAPFAMKLRPLWIWEFADITAVLFELGFVIAISRRRVLTLWLLIACVFHLMNCLILNINFSHYAICYLAFVPWSLLVPRLKSVEQLPLWGLLSIGAAMVLVGPPFKLLSFFASPSWALERGAMMWIPPIIIFAVVIWKMRSTSMDGVDSELQSHEKLQPELTG